MSNSSSDEFMAIQSQLFYSSSLPDKIIVHIGLNNVESHHVLIHKFSNFEQKSEFEAKSRDFSNPA